MLFKIRIIMVIAGLITALYPFMSELLNKTERYESCLTTPYFFVGAMVFFLGIYMGKFGSKEKRSGYHSSMMDSGEGPCDDDD